jgi:hypothetical protein
MVGHGSQNLPQVGKWDDMPIGCGRWILRVRLATVITKPLLIALILALVGCGAAPKIPAQPEEQPKAQEAEPQADSSESPPLGFRTHKIVEAANSEWVYFGQQIVVIDGDEESIPHVGIWEDDDDSHSDRINQYWRAVGKYRLSGYDCKQPWSAAFISWIMQAAGVPNDLVSTEQRPPLLS